MSDKPSVLVLFAHPSVHRSEINAKMLRATRQVEGVTTVDLYHEYPDMRIDVDREQKRLLDHDVLVFMFPVYWYSTPSILKEWQDLVLEHGFAYGEGGTALQGKGFVCAASAGGPQHAYREQGYNHFTIRELFRPLEQTALLTGMRYLPPFMLFGARTAVDEDRLPSHLEGWQQMLRQLVAKEIDWDHDEATHTSNHLVEAAS
ncbi:NAD(P)H-dependent oxidoreductase [Ferrimonas sp. YFM]|uniref:NAD(P)H-dependent oxidoreductase n=1 Tax=Ferrimonas sp. YFM TaxID=3028878 RepID=UPI0025729152|nr:NAD(P)H-dependent oxidoreductase [Ferrimonas sp. YFM]BDY04439.1 potassium transporter KefG [Ferrimonas sp. YFM]